MDTKAKRKIQEASTSSLRKLLDYDVKVSKIIVENLLRYPAFKSLHIHGKFLDLSCNGVVWFPMWMALMWLINNRHLYEMQINMLVGLFVDVIIVALLKAFIRRRRPSVDPSVFAIGPDKFSFPSGHTSRAFFIFLFFTLLWPLPKIFLPPLLFWSSSVALSRLLLRRHYLVDIVGGIIISILEAYLIKLIWMNGETSSNIISFLSSDNLPDGGLDD